MNGLRSLPCLAGLELANSEFDQPGRVDLLIGLDSMANLQMRTLDLDTSKGYMVASFLGYNMLSLVLLLTLSIYTLLISFSSL